MRRLLAGCILAGSASPALGGAQEAPADSVRSTRLGVYTAAQVALGQEIFALTCASCHSPATHTGPAFVAKWDGRPLWDLFQYVSESMPKGEPGSLSPREYGRVVAYLLKVNGMPAGLNELPVDSAALARIRLELKR